MCESLYDPDKAVGSAGSEDGQENPRTFYPLDFRPPSPPFSIGQTVPCVFVPDMFDLLKSSQKASAHKETREDSNVDRLLKMRFLARTNELFLDAFHLLPRGICWSPRSLQEFAGDTFGQEVWRYT